MWKFFYFYFYFYFLLTSQKSLIGTMSTLYVCVSTAQALSSHCSRQDHKSYCFIPYIVLTDKPLGPHWLALLRESHLGTAVSGIQAQLPTRPATCPVSASLTSKAATVTVLLTHVEGGFRGQAVHPNPNPPGRVWHKEFARSVVVTRSWLLELFGLPTHRQCVPACCSRCMFSSHLPGSPQLGTFHVQGN